MSEQHIPISLDEEPLPLPTASLLSPELQQQGRGSGASIWSRIFCSCKHPFAAFFLIFFKLVSILCYMLLSAFAITNSFVMIFIICMLLFAFDFWVTKNICGRLMVGLRWWNDVKEDGTNIWRYEAKKDMSTIGALDQQFFWLVIYIYPCIWILLTLFAVLFRNFEYLLLIIVAVTFGMVNVVGYTRCYKDVTTKNISSRVMGFVGQKYMEYLTRQ
jgi:hypothetical protein